MEKGIFKTLEKQRVTNDSMNLLWAWENQPPVMHWWFGISTICIVAIYSVLLTTF